MKAKLMMKLALAAAFACAAGGSARADEVTAKWAIGYFTDSKVNNTPYYLYVSGKDGAYYDTTSALLQKGDSSFSSSAFGSGTIKEYKGQYGASGTSTKTLSNADEANSYSVFAVFFDSQAQVVGESKYLLYTLDNSSFTYADTSRSQLSFFDSKVGDYANVAENWQVYGSTAPEPTSGVLLLVGVAALALKRKKAA